MIYNFFYSFLFSLIFSFIEAAGTELVVRLETEPQLVGICLESIEARRSGFSQEYMKILGDLMTFDFDHNGMSTVQNKGALYRIHPIIQEQRLVITVTSIENEESFVLKDIVLTGYLSEDRKAIHQAADAIHYALFGVEGIASTRLLYTVREREGGKEHSEVWEADYDGGNARRVTTRSAGYCVTPTYVPPLFGRRAGSFFYVSYETGIPKIYAASTQEGRGKRVSSLPGNQLMPSISPQRDRIAFISDVTGNPDLFIQDFSPEKGVLDKPRQIFTAPNATQSTPVFSPEGRRLAFVSSKGGTPRIYVMEIPPPNLPLKEIQPLMISKINRENTAPSWSPDGTKIAYSAMTKGVRQIWIYDLLTGAERQLTQGPLNKENPVWAPNSLHLIYNTSDFDRCELFLINLKQAKAVQISSGLGDKRFPSWESRGA